MIVLMIVNSVKSPESVLFVTFTCPLIGLVESSMVARNADISSAFASRMSIYMYAAEARLALLNLSFPEPGSESVVFVRKPYSNVAPPNPP